MIARLNDNGRYENNVLLANFHSLIMISFIGNFNGDLDNYDSADIVKLLPSRVVKKVKKSKWFRHYFDDKIDEIKPENEEDLRNVMADIKMISDEMRTYLKNRPAKWQQNYDRNFANWKKEANSGGLINMCDESDCEGFSEKPRIFAIHSFGLCLRITKINGELKIVNIYLGLAED